MLTLLSVLGSLHSFRVRSRAALELELVAPRHQLTVLRRQRPGRPRLGKSIPWPDDVWRRAGRQISVPRQQLLVHRPRHVGQDTRPIHNGPLSRLSTTASRAVRKIVPDYLRHCFLTPRVASGGGVALNAALSSCAPGVMAMNIDNGFGAAAAEIKILGIARR